MENPASAVSIAFYGIFGSPEGLRGSCWKPAPGHFHCVLPYTSLLQRGRAVAVGKPALGDSRGVLLYTSLLQKVLAVAVGKTALGHVHCVLPYTSLLQRGRAVTL